MPGRGTDEYSPEMRLVLALFEDALRSIARHPTARNRREHREYLDARAWVQDNDREWPFAFANVCDLLGLEPSAVRQRVLLGGVLPEPDRRRNRSARSGYVGTRKHPRADDHHEGHEAHEDDSQRIEMGDVSGSSS